MIDLSEYVGREVILTLDNNETLSGELQLFENHRTYRYKVDEFVFNKTGRGVSKPQIKSIQLKNPMTEIDLSKYVGKEVIYTLYGDLPRQGVVFVEPSFMDFPYCITTDGALKSFSRDGKGASGLIESIRLKDPMIDLSEYVGRKVILTLDNNETLSGEVQLFENHSSSYRTYRYKVDEFVFNKTGQGFSKPQIKSIQLKNTMTGIAQQHPNINLEDFEGQRCYVKWSDGRGSIGTILRRVSSSGSSFWEVAGRSDWYNKDGTRTNTQSRNAQVKEIYGEGAFDVTTKDTFDSPSDDVVTTATAVLKGLTEDQIAKVLHALKGKSN
jgi:small nuclear ribonucleoprotein (snRNP)-like protein